jgi:hypothetical protein
MLLQSVRDLKLRIAEEVFRPLAEDLLERARRKKLGARERLSPLRRLSLGVGVGAKPGEFLLAVRLQSRSRALDALVERLRTLAHGEMDVSFIGVPRAQAVAPLTPKELKSTQRPLVVGCSVGHLATTAGTLGMFARHRKTGRVVMLSNSHVFGQSGAAKSGEPISQPGPRDGGGAATVVGALLDATVLRADAHQQADAAIALVDGAVEFAANAIQGVGALTLGDDDDVKPGVKVMKIGRTTGFRRGEVKTIELDDVGVLYDDLGTVVFDNQIEIHGEPGLPFSDGGDSGSIVFTDELRAIGLVFCGDPAGANGAGISFANYLPRVYAALDLTPL